jgi:hypothetical protein
LGDGTCDHGCGVGGQQGVGVASVINLYLTDFRHQARRLHADCWRGREW